MVCFCAQYRPTANSLSTPFSIHVRGASGEPSESKGCIGMLLGSLLSVKRSLMTREPSLPTNAERPSSTLRRSSAVTRYHSRSAVAAASSTTV